VPRVLARHQLASTSIVRWTIVSYIGKDGFWCSVGVVSVSTPCGRQA
jgi:hypothetical protein